MLTRRQLLQLASAGLAGCVGAVALGRRTAAHDHSLHSLAAPSIAGLVDVSQGGVGTRLASRLAPPAPAPTTMWPRLWRPGDLIRSGDVNGPPIVSITCDDGPWPVNTQAMMNHMRNAGLEQHYGLIHFFMVANNALMFPDIAREVFERGYGIGNHSLTHATYNPTRLANEISPAQDVFASLFNWTPELFRSPGLTQGVVIQNECARLGMANVFTSTILNDFLAPRISSSQIINNVARTIHPGNIILLHEGGSHTQTVNALPGIIDVIHSRGYEIVRLEELLSAGTIQLMADVYIGIRSDVAIADAAELGGVDEFTDVVVELRTYLELSSNLSPERRAMVEARIAEALQARRA
ncbi:MAG: polysaccharide deacetylase family protein [Actinobacteria bacterium]|nr:polysaccharide deacetylase family protein [Actinomycetota bacterium]